MTNENRREFLKNTMAALPAAAFIPMSSDLAKAMDVINSPEAVKVNKDAQQLATQMQSRKLRAAVSKPGVEVDFSGAEAAMAVDWDENCSVLEQALNLFEHDRLLAITAQQYYHKLDMPCRGTQELRQNPKSLRWKPDDVVSALPDGCLFHTMLRTESTCIEGLTQEEIRKDLKLHLAGALLQLKGKLDMNFYNATLLVTIPTVQVDVQIFQQVRMFLTAEVLYFMQTPDWVRRMSRDDLKVRLLEGCDHEFADCVAQAFRRQRRMEQMNNVAGQSGEVAGF